MAGTEQTGEVRNSTGHGEAKGLTCATHGHEPGGDRWREGDTGQRGTEGHWDHCDSTTHTMHFTESSAGHREGKHPEAAGPLQPLGAGPGVAPRGTPTSSYCVVRRELLTVNCN